MEDQKLEFYGGRGVVFLPIILALVGLVYIALANANIPEYWVVFLLPLVLCVFLAKNKEVYSNTILKGITDPIGAILIMAVILAGICGALISKSGMISTLANYLVQANFLGNKFVGATFVLTCLVAFSTGTSVGTIFVVGPILYPVGYLVGADPALLIGAIVSGGAFGDNLSPVSDTTIASSSTQESDLGGVVRSRLKYSLPAAFIAMVLYFILGSRGGEVDISLVETGAVNPPSLLFLLIPIVIVTACLLKRHLIEALSYGIVVGIVVGFITGLVKPSDIISVPETFGAGGIILEGIQGAVPTVIIVMLMFAHISILKIGGGIDLILSSMDRFIVGVRSAEAAIVGITVLLNVATGLNTAAIVGAGELANGLGKKYKISGYRRANLLDCAGTTLNYLLPYMVPVVVGSMMSSIAAPFEGAEIVSPVQVVLSQFYPWIILIILIFAIITGYGRTFMADDTKKKTK
jgi:Na+/H+ antiporter NhaC